MTNNPSTALVHHDQRLALFRKRPDWQRLWLTLEAERWKSLAIIPTGDLSSMELVQGLAAVAWQERGAKIIVADLRTVALPALAAARSELRRRVDAGERVMIATQSLDASPTTATIAREADKALLCVHLQSALASHVRAAVTELGRQRFLGAVMVKRPKS